MQVKKLTENDTVAACKTSDGRKHAAGGIIWLQDCIFRKLPPIYQYCFTSRDNWNDADIKVLSLKTNKCLCEHKHCTTSTFPLHTTAWFIGQENAD